MITEELLDFLREQRAQGMSDAELRSLLIAQGGWEDADLDEAFRALAGPAVSAGTPSPASVTTPVITPTPAPSPVREPQALAPEPAPIASPIMPPVTAPTIPPITAPTTIAPPPPPPPPPPPAPPSGAGGVRLDQFLSGSGPARPIAEPSIARKDFNELFSRGGNVASSAYRPAPEPSRPSPPVQTQEVTPPIPPPSQPPVARPAASAAPHVNMDALVGRPSASASQTSDAGSPLNRPIKFDLSALRASSSASSASPASSTPQAEARSPLTHFGDPSTPPAATSGAPSAAALQSAPPAAPSQKKGFLSAVRTMATDLSHGAPQAMPATPTPARTSPIPSSPAVVPVHDEPRATERHESPDSAFFPDEISRRRSIKRWILVIVGIVSLLAVAGAGGYLAFTKFRSPDLNAMLDASVVNLFGSSSFGYEGKVVTDLTLTPPASGASFSGGAVKFTLDHKGALSNGTAGFGDGKHRITFSGGWQIGTTTLSEDADADLLVIAEDFYVNIMELAEATELERKLYRDHWIKMSLREAVGWLGFANTAQDEEEYGRFGGTTGATSFAALLRKSFPLVPAEGDLGKESLGGVALSRVPLRVDPDATIALIKDVNRYFFNRDLALTEEESVRLRGALAKIGGYALVDETTGTLVKVALSADFDDDMFGAHVKGPVGFEYVFADFDKPALFNTPAPVLNLSELDARVNEMKEREALVARDRKRVENATLIVTALKKYYSTAGKYPKDLTTLYTSKDLSESDIDRATLRTYLYQAYQKAGVFTKAGVCTTTGKVCGFYHIGVSLEDAENAVLKDDADQKTLVLGADEAGCAGESGSACYDLVAAPPTPAVTPP